MKFSELQAYVTENLKGYHLSREDGTLLLWKGRGLISNAKSTRTMGTVVRALVNDINVRRLGQDVPEVDPFRFILTNLLHAESVQEQTSLLFSGSDAVGCHQTLDEAIDAMLEHIRDKMS